MRIERGGGEVHEQAVVEFIYLSHDCISRAGTIDSAQVRVSEIAKG